MRSSALMAETLNASIQSEEQTKTSRNPQEIIGYDIDKTLCSSFFMTPWWQRPEAYCSQVVCPSIHRSCSHGDSVSVMTCLALGHNLVSNIHAVKVSNNYVTHTLTSW